jgi:hypothetical protein
VGAYSLTVAGLEQPVRIDPGQRTLMVTFQGREGDSAFSRMWHGGEKVSASLAAGGLYRVNGSAMDRREVAVWLENARTGQRLTAPVTIRPELFTPY